MKKAVITIVFLVSNVMLLSTEWQPVSDFRVESPAASSICGDNGEMTPICAEQLINDFNGADWFVQQSLPMIAAADRIFLKAYLEERRLELWGELGTPAMVKRRLFWAPINSLVTQSIALVGLVAGSFVVGTIFARDCNENYSIGCGYVNDAVIAGGFFGASAVGALFNLVRNKEVQLYTNKLRTLEAVEALVSLLDED